MVWRRRLADRERMCRSVCFVAGDRARCNQCGGPEPHEWNSCVVSIFLYSVPWCDLVFSQLWKCSFDEMLVWFVTVISHEWRYGKSGGWCGRGFWSRSISVVRRGWGRELIWTNGKWEERCRMCKAFCWALESLCVCVGSAMRMECTMPKLKEACAAWRRPKRQAVDFACNRVRGVRLSSRWRAVGLAVGLNASRNDRLMSAWSPSTWAVLRKGSLCVSWEATYVCHTATREGTEMPHVCIPNFSA